MTGFGEFNKSKNKKNKTFKEQIINQAIKFHSEGNISEAAKYYQYCINQRFNDCRVFSNYGLILQNRGNLKEAELSYRKAIQLNPNFSNAYLNLGNILKKTGKLQEAEFSYRKAIEINPNFVDAHFNLGNILIDLGKLQEAELSLLKAIELNPDFAMAYNSISLLKYSENNQIWQDQLFSKSILINKLPKEQVDIYFARANILHKKKKYKNSAKNLQLANNLKLDLHRTNADALINKSIELLVESDKKVSNKIERTQFPENIFIVGMPRSGSTLLESILSMRDDVYDLGEINILEESFIEYKRSKKEINLTELYFKKVNNKTKFNTITNKWLYNYQYAGIIASQILNSKIIHCYRNPLDNILSIYRAHFAKGNEYSSSLVDCANVYLNQEEIMSKYKNKFASKIYNFNYESLVRNPNQEIKSLISWLGWEWNESFLTPHLNSRSVSTRSNIEVRSPINSKSIDGWKNYKDMLKPAIEILTQTDRYRDLLS